MLKTLIKGLRYPARLDCLRIENMVSVSMIDAQKFVEMVMYSGKVKESFIETK